MSSAAVIGPDHPPIIIVAAGRSGTKLLRSILASHPATVSFPREINYIWRHGNAHYPTDELMPKHARPEVIHYIRKRFEKFGNHHHAGRLIEKTCANSLRVPFVHVCFPEAYIVHLIRDGRAVAEAARRRWMANLEPCYLFEKARWLPFSDVPYYAWRYLKCRWAQRRSKHNALSSWGPRFTGLDQLIHEKSLIEVCGLQWETCVEAANAALQGLPSQQVFTLRYEELVNNPLAVTAELFEFVKLTFEPACTAHVEATIVQTNLKKWQHNLTQGDQALLITQIGSTLVKYGYRI